jgi:hypothetical protein
MLAPSKGYPEPWYEHDRAIRFPESHGSYAFWVLCIPGGIVMTALWLTPIVWGFSAAWPYMLRFFENIPMPI